MSAEIFHPKGSMCKNCKHQDKDCTNLDFKSMHVEKRYHSVEIPTVYNSVICSSYSKIENDSVELFSREERYLVFKISDLERYAPPDAQSKLLDLLKQLHIKKCADGKTPTSCCVVESDWSIYEEVWKLIQKEYEQDLQDDNK